MEQAQASSRSLHDSVLKSTKHFHDELHKIDAKIAELQQQRIVLKAVAVAELSQSAELKELAGGNHEALVNALFGTSIHR